MSGCGCGSEETAGLERRALKTLLAINAGMFALEAAAGIAGDSAGLLADSLDMFADALVYGLALRAVGGGPSGRIRAARLGGIVQIGLGVGVVVEAVRRFIEPSEPSSPLMVGMGTLALAANVACLALLARFRGGGVHMRASWIFTANDVLANLGVIGAGALVAASGSRLPDLVIGAILAALVIRGGARILAEARREARETGGERASAAVPDRPGAAANRDAGSIRSGRAVQQLAERSTPRRLPSETSLG